MRSNIRIVRSRPVLLPLETGFTRLHSFARHRCDVVAEGVAVEDGQRPYDFDNRTRRNGCLFQYGLAGEGRFQALPAGRAVVLRPGLGFLAPFPSDTRYWLPPGATWEFIYVILNGDLAYDLVQQLVREHGHLWELPASHPAIECLRTLHLAVVDGQAPDEFETAALGYRFLMELFRAVHAPRETACPPAVDKARRCLEAEFADPALSLDRVAAAANCSKYHLSRLFKRATGRSPHAFLMQLRLQRALELVTSGGKPIKQIAQEVGYRDYAYFCKEFRRHTRRTPLSVRRLGAKLNLNLSAIHTA